MRKKTSRGFTLIEVLIVVVIMAVLAATIIPQFTDSTKDAKVSSALYNLHVLRTQIELYRTQHDGKVPTVTLIELSKKTNSAGTSGTGTLFPFGPYLRAVPANPFTNSATVTAVASSPAVAGDVTAGGGWLYNVTTGEIWVDHADYFNK